jgi:hypothetical protein
MFIFLQQKKFVGGGGGIYLLTSRFYKCFSSHVSEGKDILAHSFHNSVRTELLVSQPRHIVAKIECFDVLQTSSASSVKNEDCLYVDS